MARTKSHNGNRTMIVGNVALHGPEADACLLAAFFIPVKPTNAGFDFQKRNLFAGLVIFHAHCGHDLPMRQPCLKAL